MFETIIDSLPSSSASSFWERTSSDSNHTTVADEHHKSHSSIAPVLKNLIGAWSLETVIANSPRRVFEAPLGSSPSGMLLYDPRGHVTASIEADSDAPQGVDSTFFFSGPFALTHPTATHMKSDGQTPADATQQLVDRALEAEGTGAVLVRDVDIQGEGADRTLFLRTTETWPLGMQKEPVSLTFCFSRNEALSC